MKKVNLFLVSLVTLITLNIGLFSCGGSNTDAYVGTWVGTVENDGPDDWELKIYSDHSYILTVRDTRADDHQSQGSWGHESISIANTVYDYIVFDGNRQAMTSDGRYWRDYYNNGAFLQDKPYIKLKKQ